MRLGNGRWENTEFNSRLQPTKIGLGSGVSSQSLLKLEYSYGTTANNGNVIEQKITVPGVAHPFIQAYTYDELNRLAAAEETKNSSQEWKQTFVYDRYGNRNFNTSGSNTTTLPSGFDPDIYNPTISTTNNRFSSGQGYSYDASGNTTLDAENRKFTYDAENKQVKVETLDGSGNPTATIGEYFYDGDGKRVKKIAGSEETIFVYDAGGKLIGEYSSIVQTGSNAKTVYTTNDHLGSPRINTDVTGQVISRHDYHPFGEEIARTGYGSDTIRKQFTGYERDAETGLDFAQARYYASTVGRFSTTDSLYFAYERLFDPQQFNLYVYVRNSPLRLTDSTGLKIDTSRLNKDDKSKWDQIESLVNAVDENGKFLHPELKSLYDRLNADSRVFYIQGGVLPNATAGRFEIEDFVGDSDFKSATITLDFEKIQDAKVGDALYGDFKQFEGLETKQEKRTEVAGHEFKHAEDVLGDPEKVRLQKLVQDQERLILEANRNHTPLPANFQLNESKKNAYLERQEKTAYGAERRVLQELKNSKEQRKNNVKK